MLSGCASWKSSWWNGNAGYRSDASETGIARRPASCWMLAVALARRWLVARSHLAGVRPGSMWQEGITAAIVHALCVWRRR
jgi:hypothetical protein